MSTCPSGGAVVPVVVLMKQVQVVASQYCYRGRKYKSRTTKATTRTTNTTARTLRYELGQFKKATLLYRLCVDRFNAQWFQLWFRL